MAGPLITAPCSITASLPVYETTEANEGIAFDRLHVIIQPGESVLFVGDDMTPEAFACWWSERNLPERVQFVRDHFDQLVRIRGERLAQLGLIEKTGDSRVRVAWDAVRAELRLGT